MRNRRKRECICQSGADGRDRCINERAAFLPKHHGLVLITVPAYGFLWSEHDEALKHRRRYTAHELRNKLTVSGFEVVRTSYFISTLFFPILTLRIWQGLHKNATHPKTSLYVLPDW